MHQKPRRIKKSLQDYDVVTEIFKECVAAGCSEIPLRLDFWVFASSATEINLMEFRSELKVFKVIFAYYNNI